MSEAIARLEEAILADRDDEELYMVLADELQRAGDPRGELMVMQQRIQHTDDREARRALQRACDEWIATHDLLGPLRDFPPYGRADKADITWRYGFIRCLEIDFTGTPAAARATFEAILRHASSPFITMMVLGRAPVVDNTLSFQCLLDAMVAAERPAALRTLRIGRLGGRRAPAGSITGTLGDVSRVLHRLTKLVVETGRVRIGALELPELVDFEIDVLALDEDDLAELLELRCPRLKRLTISCDTAPAPNAVLETRLRERLGCKVRVRGHPSGYD